jgi:ribonucleoside-diphosphate reductase alpha chain
MVGLKTSFQLKTPKEIRKRDGRIVRFDAERITNAVFKAFEASAKPDRTLACQVTRAVVEKLNRKYGKRITSAVPSIEEIQDFVEEALVKRGFARVAKAYILYRQKRAEIRKEKQEILEKEVIDEVDKRFDPNALRVLKSRYLRKDENGRLIESPKYLFQRVAIHVVLADILYDKAVSSFKKSSFLKTKNQKEDDLLADKADKKAHSLAGRLQIGDYRLNYFHVKALYSSFKRLERAGRTKINWRDLVLKLKRNEFKKYQKNIDEFYNLMIKRRFLPNTPALANFGSYLGMGSACFALDVDDSIDSIMDTLKKASIIFKAGGGLGYNFSKLRPEGDFIKTTGGVSSGPISFMRLFDTMTEVVKQGGIRRGANMGIMNSNHPDIEKFIEAKQGNKALKNFNISVMIMPDFWRYYKQNRPYPLINPRTNKPMRFVSPRILLERIVYQAWESAEPGVIFYDHINKFNPFLKNLGPMVTTNPCGELVLYPNESCNLGSINLWAFVKNDASGKKYLDWQELERTIHTAVRFLDNVIDINKFPLPEIEDLTLATRKIGLGVMGLADLLYELEIGYDSPKGLELMGRIAEFLNYHSKMESIELAKERGVFPYFEKSFYKEGKMPFSAFYNKKLWRFDWKEVASAIKKHGLRNSFTTVIAPTGSISMIAGCSSGIEPVYALVYQKNVAIGSFYYIDPVFERTMLREGLFDNDLVNGVVEAGGSLQKIAYIPSKFKKIFVTSHDIKAEAHVKALAVFQQWVDSSISKTINFPREATVEDMKKVYLLAHKLGCKDLTVFRDTSIKSQVLNVSGEKKRSFVKTKAKAKEEADGLVSLKDEKAEGMVVYHDVSSVGQESANNGNNGVFSSSLGSNNVVKCPNCRIRLIFKEGCMSCPLCGWGACS